MADSGVTAQEVEILKGQLRKLGELLRNKVRQFRHRYAEEDIAFEAIDQGSKLINKSEEKLCNYLSMIIVNERVEGRYNKTRRVKQKYEDKLETATTVWLQRFNPIIVQVTSYNRARHLAENLVNVYRNQWEEMYTVTKRKLGTRAVEKEIIEGLANILKYCYHRCQDFYWKQGVFLLQYITMCTRYNIDTCSRVIRVRIKELQERCVSNTLSYIQKMVRQDILSQSNLKTVLKCHHTQKPPLRTYLDLCTESTWLMQIQDPPIALDFTEENHPIKFNPYTRPGREFVHLVWPAVLLHENGLIVSKGVAEFFDNEFESSPSLMLDDSDDA